MSSTGTAELSSPSVPFEGNCTRGSLLGSTVFPANPEGTPNVPGELFATPENTAFFCCPPNGEEGWLCFNWEKGDAAAPAGVAFESGLRQVLVAEPAPRP